MAPASKTPLEQLSAQFRGRVARARRGVGLTLTMGGVVGGALLARSGTLGMRVLGALLIAAGLAALVAIVRRYRQTLRDRRLLIERVLLRADPDAGGRVLRALDLVQRRTASEHGESEDLTRLHFERAVAKVEPAKVERHASRESDRLRIAALALLLGSLAAFVFDPFRVFEGLDVLVARRGTAPVSMQWLSSLRIVSQPPAYLRSAERVLFPIGEAHEAAGSVLLVQGVPEREGRRLVLRGGDKEVPFVSDGAGGVVARWVLERDVELVVAARFGEVLIGEPEALSVRAIVDEAPRVVLEGAPRTVKLREIDSLELRYQATDDHGLRQVDVVLRSGAREERQTLERLDGEIDAKLGAHALSPTLPFLRRAFLPVTVTVEARDNDTASGAKWGKSESIVVLPPGVGEAESLRFAALRAARDTLVSALAVEIVPPDPKDLKFGTEPERKRRVAAALEPLRVAVDGTYAGLSVPRPLTSFLLGQARALERPAPTKETFLRRFEDVVLAVDAALRATGDRDAQSVSKRLADVATEVADASRLGIESDKRPSADARLAAALPVLEAGASALFQLSVLGGDLGSVAQGETRRIRRALAEPSYQSAELAARHLAARLRRPKPSFSSAGGGGVESGGQGGGRGGAGPPGEASQAHQQFEELMQELRNLASEHADEIGAVERAMEQAQQGDADEALKNEARSRADALRRAIEQLPPYGASEGTAESAAAMAREHARAMAESLERLSLRDARDSGKSAQNRLEEASRKQGSFSALDPGAVSSAQQELERQLRWTEELLDKAQQGIDERAKQALEQSGRREQGFAERAQNLSGRGSHGEAALPNEVAEALDRAEGLMRDAARELSSGKGEQGAELQREAQRWLEQTDDRGDGGGNGNDSESERAPSPGDRDGQGKNMRMDAEVPGKDAARRAEDFRRRVLEGLGRDKGGRLSPAVKRYAEGLLR